MQSSFQKAYLQAIKIIKEDIDDVASANMPEEKLMKVYRLPI